MKIKNIISVILLFALLFSTIGLTFHYHICGETGTKSINLFQAPKCSCDEKSSNLNTNEDLPSCCQVHNFATKERIKSELCCFDFQTTVKISDDFIAKISCKFFIINIPFNINFDAIFSKLIDENNYKIKIKYLKTAFSVTRTIIYKFIEFFGSYDNEDSIISL